MVNIYKTAAISAVITIFVFLAGVWFGMTMQETRVNEIKQEYLQMQISWNDIQLQSDIIMSNSLKNEDICQNVVEKNLKFGDQIYEKGKKIETYEKRNEFSEDLETQKREHNLLKLQFWVNLINIKKSCNSNYINVVYFYEDDGGKITKIKQDKISEILFELKQEYGQEMMLIPIAKDLDLSSVDTVIAKYKIETFPSVLINENILITDVPDKESLKKIIDEELEKQN